MTSYENFAEVYDIFMDEIPYARWSKNICSLLRQNGVSHGTIAELGCGTGRMSRLLADAGYDIIGIDQSDAMLEIAMTKEEYRVAAHGSGCGCEMCAGSYDDYEETTRGSLCYMKQDMRVLTLGASVDAIVSICDSMNYLIEEGDLQAVFARAMDALVPGGLLLFDLKTPYLYREVLGEQTFADNRNAMSLIWENYYDEATHINEYDITIYRQDETLTHDGVEGYCRFDETHLQRAYEPSEVWEAVERSGLQILCMLDADTMGEMTEESERIYVMAKKPER